MEQGVIRPVVQVLALWHRVVQVALAVLVESAPPVASQGVQVAQVVQVLVAVAAGIGAVLVAQVAPQEAPVQTALLAAAAVVAQTMLLLER